MFYPDAIYIVAIVNDVMRNVHHVLYIVSRDRNNNDGTSIVVVHFYTGNEDGQVHSTFRII